MATDAPITQHDAGVLVSGAALPLLYRATLALAVRHRHDGVTSPPLLHQARLAFYRAMSARGHRDAPPPPSGGSSDRQHGDLIDSAQAARLLKLSMRQTRRLASGLHGVRVGSIWLFDRGAVLALADERPEHPGVSPRDSSIQRNHGNRAELPIRFCCRRRANW